MGNWLGRAFLFVLVVLALAPAAQAEDVFLIVSLEPEFDTAVTSSEDGSPTVIVRIGSLTNDVPDPRETVFEPETESPPSLPVGEIDLSGLEGNESTIFGSYTVEDFESESTEAHMVTPGAANIDGAIQAAVFAASGDLAEAVVTSGGFMSTGQIASIVYDAAVELAGGSEGYEGPTIEDIALALFGATEPLGVTDLGDGTFTCEAEGELLPHPKDQVEPIFTFGFLFNEDGDLTFDMCLPADVEVKESSVNLKKKGSVSIAIYDSETLETDDIVSVEIRGVSADKIQVSKNKATAQFDVQDLYDAFALTSSTTQVLVVATLEDENGDEICFAGIAEINVK